MEADSANILTDVRDRRAFREWLERNHATEADCWVEVKRGRPTDGDVFWYLDAVEEALCFGWVDSIHKEIGGVRLQRFTPRKPRSAWTELNKDAHQARRDVRRVERLRTAARLLNSPA